MKKSAWTPTQTCTNGTHERTDATETTLGLGRSPLNSPSLRASPHDESTTDQSPTGFAQQYPPARRCGRDAAPTDKLGRRRPRGRALGARPGPRGAAAISSNPEAAARRPTNRGDVGQRHGEANNHKRNNRRRLLRLCGRVVSTLIISQTRDRSRSHDSWFTGSAVLSTVYYVVQSTGAKKVCGY